MTYAEKLTNPKWQRKRLEIFHRDNWKCTACGREDESLHIHHKKYIKGAEPWKYDSHLLTTLCHSCHKKEHEQIIDPERKYEHLIIYQEEPAVINSLNIKLGEAQKKLKENISVEVEGEILKYIVFLKQQKKQLVENSK